MCFGGWLYQLHAENILRISGMRTDVYIYSVIDRLVHSYIFDWWYCVYGTPVLCVCGKIVYDVRISCIHVFMVVLFAYTHLASSSSYSSFFSAVGVTIVVVDVHEEKRSIGLLCSAFNRTGV